MQGQDTSGYRLNDNRSVPTFEVRTNVDVGVDRGLICGIAQARGYKLGGMKMGIGLPRIYG
jgi:hypothetical protein